jgi:hypothetical protein
MDLNPTFSWMKNGNAKLILALDTVALRISLSWAAKPKKQSSM